MLGSVGQAGLQGRTEAAAVPEEYGREMGSTF